MKKEKFSPKSLVTDTIDDILEQLDRGIIPWEKPWFSPCNAWNRYDGKPYSILNQFRLPEGEYATPSRLIKENIDISGAKCFRVVKFFPHTNTRINKETGEEETYVKFSVGYEKVIRIEDLNIEPKYNKEQIVKKFVEDLNAEGLIKKYIEREGVSLKHNKGDSSYYSTNLDSITLPYKKHFKTRELYYSTAFHEIAHSTGAKTRLNRDLSGTFGDSSYAKEELIAEISAASIMKLLGLETKRSKKNTAAYTQSWSNRIKENTNILSRALQNSTKAVEFICGAEF